MGSQRRLNKKTSWEATSLPVRNPLQTRPFGKGIQARRAELPTTNVLQTRPFGTPKQESSPKQEMPDLQAQLEQVKRSGYNAANIPTLAPSSATPIQAKLTIGEPNDKYEQEADQVASQVVNQINSPQTQPSVQGKTVQRQEMPEEEEELQAKPLAESIQRQEIPEEEEELQAKPLAESIQRQEIPEEEEELQAKPLAESIQRQEIPEEEEELQAKPLAESIQRQEIPEEEEELQAKPLAESIQRQEIPEEEEELQAKPLAESIQRQEMPEEEEELQMKPLVQRKSSGGGMAATPELEQSIASARGSGQPIADEVRQPMEQAFGADFSGVKIHTDSKADQLNRSVGARAFTTGQDVFFRQGEYNPGSKDGQELMAHEFTHVLQQTDGLKRQIDIDDKEEQEEPTLQPSADRMHRQSKAGNESLIARKRDSSSPIDDSVVQRDPTEITFDESETDVITGRVSQIGAGRTSTQEIDSQVERLKEGIDNFWENYDRGLANFQTLMVFESEQEAEPKYLDAALKATGKFILDQAIGKLPGQWGIAANLLKGLAEGWIAEKARSDAAAGGAKIGAYIVSIRNSIGSHEKAMLKAVESQRIPLANQYQQSATTSPGGGAATQDGVITGDAAEFLQELKKGVDNFEAAIPGAPFFQQRFTEAFASTGARTDLISQGGRMSGQLYLSMNVYKDGNEWSIESCDNAWTLATTAPKPERLAENLESALTAQGLQIYQSNLPKLVSIRIEVEEWGLNSYQRGHIYFVDAPGNYEVRGWYGSRLFRQAWEMSQIRGKATGVNKVLGSKK